MGSVNDRLKIIAHSYVTSCARGDTSHAHALEMLIVRGIVTYEELDLDASRLKFYILREATERIKRFRANGGREAQKILGSFLNCGHICSEVINESTALLSREELDDIRRQDAIETARWYLEHGVDTDSGLWAIRELVDDHDLKPVELSLSCEAFIAMLEKTSP